MATHYSILAWKIPWTEEPGGLQSMGSRRVRHSWEANSFTSFFKHIKKKKLLEVSCFTVSYWFLPYINMNQLQVCICPLPLEPASHLPPHPSRLSQRLGWAPGDTQQIPAGYLFYTWQFMFPCYYSICPSLSFPHFVYKSVLCEQVYFYFWSK